MKKILSLFATTLILASCKNQGSNIKNKSDELTLNIYNCADYIYEKESPEDPDSVIDQFVDYYRNKTGKTVTVNYSTFETLEDMYNQMKAGGVRYDLVCPSEYMVTKLIQNDMLEKIDGTISNYETYGSQYIHDVYDNITCKDSNGNDVLFKDYAIPYMWGTIGLMYDSEVDGIEEACKSWDVIWDETFKNQASLKDSIRDSYAVGVLYAYKNELMLAQNKMNDDEFNDYINEVMNRCDDYTISLVETVLKKAKENVYEFEVDTGKENIIKGKYAINLCWSGDACYAIDEANEVGKTLKFEIPKEGSNIWFDGFVMPKGANKVLAQEFMNFMCNPEIASLNMDYIGYTSAICDDDNIFSLIKDNYQDDDGTIDYDLKYFFGNDNKYIIKTNEELLGKLKAQYPSSDQLYKLAVMKDFGSQTEKVTEMWIRVKGNSISWIIIVFLVFVVGIIVFFEIKSALSKRARKSRNK